MSSKGNREDFHSSRPMILRRSGHDLTFTKSRVVIRTVYCFGYGFH